MSPDTLEHFAAGSVGNPEECLAASHTPLFRHPRRRRVLSDVTLSSPTAHAG